MSESVPIFSVFCIDFRYDNLTANFFQGIGLLNSYFAATAAGGALPLGYKCSCSEICKKGKCNPSNGDMTLLRENLVKNLEIALTLKPIEKLYIYDGLKKIKYGNTNTFIPRIKKLINEYEISNLKPGFNLQYQNFKKFLINQRYYGIKIDQAQEIMSICKKITK